MFVPLGYALRRSCGVLRSTISVGDRERFWPGILSNKWCRVFRHLPIGWRGRYATPSRRTRRQWCGSLSPTQNTARPSSGTIVLFAFQHNIFPRFRSGRHRGDGCVVLWFGRLNASNAMAVRLRRKISVIGRAGRVSRRSRMWRVSYSERSGSDRKIFCSLRRRAGAGASLHQYVFFGVWKFFFAGSVSLA